MAAVTHRIEPRPSRAAAAALLESAGLPSSDLTDAHMEHFFFCGPAAQPSGIIGIEVGGEAALLRSLVVAAEHRATGMGAALTERAERHARERGARSLYLLTTTAEDFFARRGYVSAARESAPAAIKNTREFAGLCPASSAFMVKQLF
jgi:amino-acid N-acetyltransferase